MYRQLLTLGILLLFSGYGFSQRHQEAALVSSRDEQAICKTLNDFMLSWNKHDATAFGVTFTEDADFTNVRGDTAHGRAAIDAFHATIFKGRFKNSRQSLGAVKIRPLTADLAMVDAHWDMTGDISPVTGQEIPLRKGLLSFVMKRVGTEWLILIMHNTDLPSH
ncbi:conserved hypothetical protein [Chitinophaga costaii]|uniref:DUF4440 domain-containing protein n=1 Tax=Chitinophaga costaii TaxID=1335309 RepID=A0A1C4AV62_9BACT|nr:SgcJ/EcaC family oxidoreductase [Chitinophaga costaii]PUZ26757.1 SgcJ/EcaC family oxidoreductase [Chitinophaga costaii]SCB98471.1 conserved hypothetical protein [Chitinophaga costaii]